MSPFYLLFTQMKMKKDLIIIRNIIEEAASFQEEREQSRELAKQFIIKIQEKNKRIINIINIIKI